jgi:hypothetical protein
MLFRTVSIIAMTMSASIVAMSQVALESDTLFEGNTVTRSAKGAPQPLHVNVSFWKFNGKADLRTVPVRGFYIARAAGGEIRTVIDGKREDRMPEDIWLVADGTSMQAQAINEYASIETIAISLAPTVAGPSRDQRK